jgi:hypothetical protein
MKPTQDQIVARIEKLMEGNNDFLGKRKECLIFALDFEHAKPYLVEGVEAADWEGPVDPVAAATDYLEFAVSKIVGERGISANRSTDAYGEWVWLALGDDAFADYEAVDYGWYGRTQVGWAADMLGVGDQYRAEMEKQGADA